MNHRTANGRAWLLTGWRAWVVSFAAVLLATGTLITGFMRLYEYSPFWFRDQLSAEASERKKLEAKVDQQADQQARINNKLIRYLSLESVILTKPDSHDDQEIRDAKRRMRRMFVIDPSAEEPERGR